MRAGDGSDGENEPQDDDDTESVYGRLEETRLQLEEELGCDDFLKAYKTVQVKQHFQIDRSNDQCMRHEARL